MALYHIRQIGLDGHDLTAMIDFWSAALGYELDHRRSGYAVLRDPAAAEPRLFLQQVAEPKVAKNRVHVDVEVPDERLAVDRLVQLGARVLWREDFQTHHWTVLADPEGERVLCRALRLSRRAWSGSEGWRTRNRTRAISVGSCPVWPLRRPHQPLWVPRQVLPLTVNHHGQVHANCAVIMSLPSWPAPGR